MACNAQAFTPYGRPNRWRMFASCFTNDFGGNEKSVLVSNLEIGKVFAFVYPVGKSEEKQT